MPDFNEIVDFCRRQPDPCTFLISDFMRKLNELSERNVIAYYSAWQQKQELSRQGFQGFGIDDLDMNSFMAVVNGLDRAKGLDLILHTPGGSVAAAESLIDYLKDIFESDIRTIIPQMAMSAGTLISISSKEIVMGKHSSLGPIDPQINGLAAESILAEFQEAHDEIVKNPGAYPVYKARLENYPPTLLVECENAVALGKELAKQNLLDCMLKSTPDAEVVATQIVEHLSSHKQTKIHGRHISAKSAKALGLKIIELETLEPKDKKGDDGTVLNSGMQDVVLSIHHAFTLLLGSTDTVKIVQNHKGGSSIATVQTRSV